jgi:hypothetical protein
VSLRKSPDIDLSPKTGFHHPYIVNEPSFSIAGVTNQAEIGQLYIANFCAVCLFTILILFIRPRRSQLLVIEEFVNDWRAQMHCPYLGASGSMGHMFESSYGSCRYPRALRRDDQSTRTGNHTDSPNRSQSLVGQAI